MAISKKDIEQFAGNLVRQEKINWEDAEAFVTEKVAFRMRDLIRQCRKNYYGVFDKPIDIVTGRKKIWYPLTEELCNAVMKNIDLDTKDVNIRSKNPNGRKSSSVVRALIRNYLEKITFGELLDVSELQLAIDGTVVWKTLETPAGPETKMVDLLNFYIDPTADSIQKTPTVIERAVMTKSEFEAYDWINKDMVNFDKNIVKTDPSRLPKNVSNGETDLVDVYERWGLMPKWLITGKVKDKKSGELIEGRIVVSGLDRGGFVVHAIEENKRGTKPYEEAWYTKIAGRWYGRGIAERTLMLQAWINIIINIRINRSYTAQLGLYKIRKSAGITPQMLKRLPTSGAVVVNNMDDVEQMVMQDASPASYTDEQNINSIARRVTSAFEVVTGEGLPASTPATNATIQRNAAQSSFSVVKENLGMFIERWVNRHVIPILGRTTKKGEVVRVVGDDPQIKEFREKIILDIVAKRAREINEKGEFLTQEQLMALVESVRSKIENDDTLFMDYLGGLSEDNYDTKVYVTNEEMDIGVMIDKLNFALSVAPEEKNTILPAIYDLMGIDVPKGVSAIPRQSANQPAQPLQGQSPQQQTTRANSPFKV